MLKAQVSKIILGLDSVSMVIILQRNDRKSCGYSQNLREALKVDAECLCQDVVFCSLLSIPSFLMPCAR